MEQNENEVVIGIRGKALQGLTASIMFIVFGGIFLLIGLFLSFIIISSGEDGFITGFIILAVFSVLFGACLFVGILNVIYVRNNDSILNTPVLIYKKEEDIFVGYDCHHSNKEVIIKNGDIQHIKGSAVWTGRELFVYYNDNQGNYKKVSLGYCRNIDNNAFRHKLNQYHKYKL